MNQPTLNTLVASNSNDVNYINLLFENITSGTNITGSTLTNTSYFVEKHLSVYTFILYLLIGFLMILPTIMEMTPYQVIQIVSNNLNDYDNITNETLAAIDTPEESESDDENEGFPEKKASPEPIILNNITTIYKLGREPNVGNIIRFTERNSKSNGDKTIRTECTNIQQNPPRCISTYNQCEIEPDAGSSGENGELYVVVSKTNLLPNPKGYAVTAALGGDSSIINTTNTHLIVEPLSGLEPNESIFWYINITDLTVRQFEGGAVKMQIDNLEIIGNDDGVRRSSAPSPDEIYDDTESNYDYNEEEYTSTSSEIDYPEQESSEEYNSDYNRELYYDYSSTMYGYGGDYNFNDGDY
jgi:hypothetical protein